MEFVVSKVYTSGQSVRVKAFDGPKSKADALGYARRSAKLAEAPAGTRFVVSDEYGREVGSATAKGTGTRAQPSVPELFERLNARDWAHVREVSAQQSKGDEEAIMTSVGYIDVGKLPGGLAYVAGQSAPSGGAGPLEYRKVMSNAWR